MVPRRKPTTVALTNGHRIEMIPMLSLEMSALLNPHQRSCFLPEMIINRDPKLVNLQAEH